MWQQIIFGPKTPQWDRNSINQWSHTQRGLSCSASWKPFKLQNWTMLPTSGDFSHCRITPVEYPFTIYVPNVCFYSLGTAAVLPGVHIPLVGNRCTTLQQLHLQWNQSVCASGAMFMHILKSWESREACRLNPSHPQSTHPTTRPPDHHA